MQNREKVLFIINPISGIGKQKKIIEAIEKTLDKDRFEYEIVYTQYAHHATEICRDIAGKGIDIIAVVGGDGSINDCVRGLEHTNMRLAIIPAGSGNGLARSLKIPLNLNEAIKIINQGQSICIDTICLNDIVYASIAGVGFDAVVAKEFAKVKMRGFNAYFQIVALQYPNYKSLHYKLDIDGEKIETEALFICFANSNQFGYNTLVAPSASLTDGFMDVICVKKIPLPLLPFAASLLFTKRFEQSVYVQSYKAKCVRLHNEDIMPINIDGEYLEKNEDIVFTMRERSLNVIIP